MWYGLQLQLLLYLKAATAAGAGEPAGAFYFTVSDPMCDSVQDLKAAAEAAIAKELRLKGVVLADAEVISAMDAEEPGFSVEKVFNADGTVSRNATAVDREEMGALLRHAQKLAAELGPGPDPRRRIAAQPAALGEGTHACIADTRAYAAWTPRWRIPRENYPRWTRRNSAPCWRMKEKPPERGRKGTGKGQMVGICIETVGFVKKICRFGGIF